MINKHESNKIKENSNTVRHLNNGTDHRHSKSCCDQSSPARRTIRDLQQWYSNLLPSPIPLINSKQPHLFVYSLIIMATGLCKNSHFSCCYSQLSLLSWGECCYLLVNSLKLRHPTGIIVNIDQLLKWWLVIPVSLHYCFIKATLDYPITYGSHKMESFITWIIPAKTKGWILKF